MLRFPNELLLFDLLSNADLFSQASLFIYTKLITLILTTTVYIYIYICKCAKFVHTFKCFIRVRECDDLSNTPFKMMLVC